MYWRVGDVTLTDDWAKIICRVIGEQNAEPLPGRVEVRWEWAAPPPSGAQQQQQEAGSGISVARLLPAEKGKGKAVAEEDPFADAGAASPPASPDFVPRNWADVPLVRRLVGGKYESR